VTEAAERSQRVSSLTKLQSSTRYGGAKLFNYEAARAKSNGLTYSYSLTCLIRNRPIREWLWIEESNKFLGCNFSRDMAALYCGISTSPASTVAILWSKLPHLSQRIVRMTQAARFFALSSRFYVSL